MYQLSGLAEELCSSSQEMASGAGEILTVVRELQILISHVKSDQMIIACLFRKRFIPYPPNYFFPGLGRIA